MRVFYRLLAALLCWTLIILSGPTSPAAAAPNADKPRDESAVGGRRNSLGELTAPDEVSAKAIARLTGERVEVVGARSEFSSSWALPNGSLSSGVAAGPVRVQVGGDGEELEDWLEIDLDLVAGSDGWVRPKGHVADLKFVGTSALSVTSVVVMANRGRPEDSLSLGWSGLLPEPTLAGPRATYAEVFPGVDLVLEATRTGFEQYFVLKRRPADGVAPKLMLPLSASGRYELRADRAGGASVVVGDEEAARVGVPLVWDSKLDAERTHPVTQPWAWSSPELSGLARSIGRQPDWKDSPVPDLSRPGVFPKKWRRDLCREFVDVSES